MRRALLFLLFLTGYAVAQNALPIGSFDGSVYTNDALGFTYSLPEGYAPIADSPSALVTGAKYLFIADARSGLFSRNRVLLVADDASQHNQSLRDYADGFTRMSARMPGTVLVHDATEVRFASKTFYRSDLNEHGNAGVLYKSVLCTERRGYFLMWFIVAQSQEEQDVAVRSLNAISFHDDGRDVSYVPKKTIPLLPGKLVRVSETESRAFILKKAEPEYPANAHRSGKVVLRVIIDPDGVIRDVTVISGEPPFTAAALQAVQRYRYKPYVWKDHLVQMETRITMVFGPPSAANR